MDYYKYRCPDCRRTWSGGPDDDQCKGGGDDPCIHRATLLNEKQVERMIGMGEWR